MSVFLFKVYLKSKNLLNFYIFTKIVDLFYQIIFRRNRLAVYQKIIYHYIFTSMIFIDSVKSSFGLFFAYDIYVGVYDIAVFAALIASGRVFGVILYTCLNYSR